MPRCGNCDREVHEDDLLTLASGGGACGNCAGRCESCGTVNSHDEGGAASHEGDEAFWYCSSWCFRQAGGA